MLLKVSIEVHHYQEGPGGSAQSLSEIVTRLQSIEKKVDQIIMTDAELKALLNKIDTTTNKVGENVQTIGNLTQTISDEMDAFIAAHPAGTPITAEEIAQLQGIADRQQALSDASDALVPVLQGVAA